MVQKKEKNWDSIDSESDSNNGGDCHCEDDEEEEDLYANYSDADRAALARLAYFDDCLERRQPNALCAKNLALLGSVRNIVAKN